MSMDLNKQTFTSEPEYFIAGTTVRIATAVKKAGADIKAHNVVNIAADGKVSPIAAPGEGETLETKNLYGIAAEDFAKDGDAVIYLTGEFFANALNLPEGVTAADVEVAFRNIGIFLK